MKNMSFKKEIRALDGALGAQTVARQTVRYSLDIDAEPLEPDYRIWVANKSGIDPQSLFL